MYIFMLMKIHFFPSPSLLSTSVLLPSDLHLKSEAELNAWAASQVGHDAIGLPENNGPCYKCSLYDASGQKITHCSQLKHIAASVTSSQNYLNGTYRPIALQKNEITDGSQHDDNGGGGVGATTVLEGWVVAPDRWFVYPVGQLGRAVEIKRVKPPRGDHHPIMVESIR
jgi:hypothetical protein